MYKRYLVHDFSLDLLTIDGIRNILKLYNYEKRIDITADVFKFDGDVT